MTKKTLLISGGNGRLASELQRQAAKYGHSAVCLDIDKMDVTDKADIDNAILVYKPDVFIHCAAILDGTKTALALEVNITGTVNVVLSCFKYNVKLIYLSTDYVYPKARLNHAEEDPLLPFTLYGWTKLGGECAVRTYPNSLIIRGAMCPRPYPHKAAYTDVKKNLIYQDEVAGYILQLLNETGVINVGKKQSYSLYDFAQKTREDVQPATSPQEYEPKHSHLSVSKLHGALRKTALSC